MILRLRCIQRARGSGSLFRCIFGIHRHKDLSRRDTVAGRNKAARNPPPHLKSKRRFKIAVNCAGKLTAFCFCRFSDNHRLDKHRFRFCLFFIPTPRQHKRKADPYSGKDDRELFHVFLPKEF